jgi:hypothetical protein
VTSQSEAASSYASGSHDIDMEDVDVEFDPQAYFDPVKRWTGDSYQKARTVCAYEKEEDSLAPQFRTKAKFQHIGLLKFTQLTCD